eukprot:m.230522 g.230522  ORF g.230522 m.230522 type:complete len:219 (+) comp17353_c0_seq37:235-891(+)
MHPLAPHETLIEKAIDEFNPPTYAYLLGPDILVHPINTAGSDNHTTVKVAFPNSSGWVYWFNTSQVYRGSYMHALFLITSSNTIGTGGSEANLSVPLWESPVFHRTGAIIPLNNPRNASELHVHVFYPKPGQSHQFDIRTNDYAAAAGLGLRLSFEHHEKEVVLNASAHHTFSVQWHLHGLDVQKDCFQSNWRRESTSIIIPTDVNKGSQIRVPVAAQ